MCLISLSLAVLLQAIPPSQKAESTIAGVVSGQDGKAIPGAVVLLSDTHHPGGKAPTRGEDHDRSPGTVSDRCPEEYHEARPRRAG